MNQKSVGILGAIAVIIGVFSPLINLPIIGSISYASQRQGEGVLMCAAAVIAGLCCLAQIGWPSVIAGLIVLTDVIWTGVNLSNLLNNVDTTNPFTVALMRTVSPGFGFALLIIGGIMLAISPFFKGKPMPEPVWDKTGVYGKAPESPDLTLRLSKRSSEITEISNSLDTKA